MSISVRFSIIVSSLLFILFFMLATTSYIHDREMVSQENLSTARIVAKGIIATRDYLSAEATPEMISRNMNLTPQVAATKIAKKLTSGSDYYVRQVSLRYRNPANKPDVFEERELKKFSEGSAKESNDITGHSGHEVLRYMLPMIAGTSCLNCHGTFESAPEFVKKRFPKGHPSYNYKAGEVIGAISVSIPMASQLKSIHSDFVSELMLEGFILLTIIIVTSLLIHRSILAPVKKVSQGIASVALTGNFSSVIKSKNNDEIGRLIKSFNELVSELDRRTRQRTEADERYRNFIEIAQSPIVTFLADGKVVISNLKAEKLFGITREELLGQSIFDFMIEPEPLKKGMKDYFSDGSSEFLGVSSIQKMRDICGRQFDVEMVVSVSQTESDAMFSAILRPHGHQ